MANIDKSDENKKLKRQLRQAQSKIDKMSSEIKDLKTKNKILSAESKKKQRKLILSSLTEKEREIVELLFPDTDTGK
jgi:TolA-binding protein